MEVQQEEKTNRKEKNSLKRFANWLQGSFRRRLTIFVVLLCLLLVCLVWVFAIQLMEPVYNSYVRQDLENVMYGVNSVLEKANSQGIEIAKYSEEEDSYALNPEVAAMIQKAVYNGLIPLGESSIDVSSKDLKYIFSVRNPNLGSTLHPEYTLYDGVYQGIETNGMLVTTLRLLVQQQGYFYNILSSGQMIVGMTALSGEYNIIVSANTEKIPQSVNVLKELMLPVLLLLLLVSIFATWLFSGWFTKPLRQLSTATKEVAKGNYDVVVKEEGQDEISELARDFNTMTQEVKRSNELQRDLIANVSHDLRTPLTIIKGYAETVRDISGDDPVKRNEQLSVIISETDRLSALVNSVMELSRMSSGHEKPVPVRFDLTELCDEVTFRYNEICRQKGYTFEFVSENNCEVYADPALIERALHNYLGNAFKHVGEDGYMGMHVFKTKQGNIRVEVIDHGSGVPAEDLPYLFDKYYRSRADEGKQGTGLGLSIAKAIFIANHCKFGVESKLGEGSVFWFEALPASVAIEKFE